MNPPNELESAMYGFMASHCLFSAAELGVFDLLAKRATTTAALADLLKVEAASLERILLGLASLGLVQDSKAGYAITPRFVRYLDPASPDYRGGRFSYFQQQSARMFGFLSDAVRENRPQWHRLDGNAARRDAFADIYSSDARTTSFVECMWNLSWADESELVSRIDLSTHRRIVDVGGCSGSFAIAALLRFPALTAVVFDRAEVRAHCLRRAEEHGVLGRLQFQVGDFFVDALPEGDLYSLGYILSDWSQADGTALMQRMLQALPSRGRLIVLEKLFADDKAGPLPTAMMNLCMLLEQEGKHRSGLEYEAWLRAVGFATVDVYRSRGEKHAIVGTKA